MIPTASASYDPSAAERLRAALHGALLTPQDPGYDEARRVWNAIVDRRPSLVARCADSDDVARAILFGREQGLEVGVKCGGHGITGIAVPVGGLLIDLSPMNAVEVDPQRRLARVGGGALLGDLDRATLPHGLATTAGNVSHTGVGGLTLGGGMGWLARRLGLACDNVTSYALVAADGTRLTASAEEHPDLFWALQGGGGNFGAVTEFTFRLHPTGAEVLSVDLVFPLEAAGEALAAWAEWAVSAPDEATPTAAVVSAAEWEVLPVDHRGRPVVAVGFIWAGEREAGRALLPALRAIGPAIAEVVEETDYLTLQTGGDEPMRHGLRRYWKGHYLPDLGPAAVGAFLGRGGPGEAGESLPNGFLQAYGGAIGRVAPEETAFSHRDAPFEFIVMAGWEDPADDERQMGAARRYGRAMEPFASGVYVNGLSDEGAEGVRQAYAKGTLDRLRAVKGRYDPDNVFHLNHNIEPAVAG